MRLIFGTTKTLFFLHSLSLVVATQNQLHSRTRKSANFLVLEFLENQKIKSKNKSNTKPKNLTSMTQKEIQEMYMKMCKMAEQSLEIQKQTFEVLKDIQISLKSKRAKK